MRKTGRDRKEQERLVDMDAYPRRCPYNSVKIKSSASPLSPMIVCVDKSFGRLPHLNTRMRRANWCTGYLSGLRSHISPAWFQSAPV